MSFTDPIGDMITRIRNGQMRSYVKIEMPASSFKGKILEILKREGFILNYSLDQTNERKTKFSINLKYNSGSPVINNIERISRPGRRFYSSAQSIPKIQNGLGIAIISTPKGVMTDTEARKAKVGGEIICKVFWCQKLVKKNFKNSFEATNFGGKNPWNDKVKLVRKKGIYEFYRPYRWYDNKNSEWSNEIIC